jgi:F-type H+-transporting ATPase subunit b
VRRLLLIAILILLPAALFAWQTSGPQPNDVAHGSEKVSHEAAHPNEEHGGAHEEPKFLGLPAWIFKLINMIAFLAFLGWAIGGPIRKALADRRANIAKAADEAAERRAKADQLAADIQKRLAQIEQDVRSIHERAEQEGERQKRELIAAADAEAQKILQNARTEVDNQLKHARHELTEFAGQLAAERAEALLRERINPQDQARLFDESLREVEEVKG